MDFGGFSNAPPGVPARDLRTRRAPDRDRRARSVSSGRWASHNIPWLPTRRPPSLTCSSLPETICALAPELIRCAATTTCRVPAIGWQSMPNTFPGYQKVEDEAVREKFEKRWNRKLSAKKGLDNHEMVDAMLEGKHLKGMYLIGEEMQPRRFQQQLRRRGVLEAGFSRGAGYLSHRRPAATRTSCCQLRRVSKKRAHLPARNGASSVSIRCSKPLGRKPPRLGDPPERRAIASAPDGATSIRPKSWTKWRRLTRHSMRGVTYEAPSPDTALSNGPSRLMVPISPCSIRSSSTSRMAKRCCYPLQQTGKSRSRRAGQRIRSPPQQRPPARTFPPGKSAAYRVPGIKENTPDTFVEVSPQLAAERGVTKRQLGAARIASCPR